MHEFLTNNRDELVRRCKEKVSGRPRRAATEDQLKNGIPLFLGQLINTLKAEREGHPGDSVRISGLPGGDLSVVSEIGISATAHGKQLLELGYTVNQVVHDYGDLCQAITDLAVARDAPFTVQEFRTLNRCLDNAIAEAVTEFSGQRDAAITRQHAAAANERLGFLVHELRNSLHTARLAFTALETGQLPVSGATGGVLRRSLATLASLVNRSLTEVRLTAEPLLGSEVVDLATFIADAANAALLDANMRGCHFAVKNEAGPGVAINVNRELILGAVVNLLQNAFKFTRPGSDVLLHAYVGDSGEVHIDVADHCGGLPPGTAETMFLPFTRHSPEKSGLGLGLSIARRNVEASAGSLTVRDVPGVGCVFSIRLPRHEA